MSKIKVILFTLLLMFVLAVPALALDTTNQISFYYVSINDGYPIYCTGDYPQGMGNFSVGSIWVYIPFTAAESYTINFNLLTGLVNSYGSWVCDFGYLDGRTWAAYGSLSDRMTILIIPKDYQVSKARQCGCSLVWYASVPMNNGGTHPDFRPGGSQIFLPNPRRVARGCYSQRKFYQLLEKSFNTNGLECSILDILIDYFRATFKELELSDIIEYLGLENLNWLEGKPRDGWSQHDYFNGIHLYSCGREDVGIELSGVGCRTLESVNGLSFDWLALFRWVVDLGDHANVSRLDVAGDEKDGILDFSTMVKHTRLGKYISKARKRIWIDGDEREIMWGASSSSTRLRIYDKALERGVDGHWIRAEFQFRDEAADSFIANYLSFGDIGLTYGGVLLNYLRYTTRAPNPEKSHNYDALNTAKWWDKFVGTSQKIHNFTVGGLPYNLQSLEDFISTQCASSIRAFIEVSSVDRLLDIVKHTPYSSKQKQLLSSLGVAVDA